jgi:rSAM/selenodomain-associated transferase 2
VRLSVIIPALDEEAAVEDAIASVRDDADEIVVVDGGSQDATAARAARAGATVLHRSGGRGAQLDHGARAASGDWLVFLHADTRFDGGWARDLRALPASVVGGAFRFAVASARTPFRVIEAGVALRCAWLRLPYGDQALFARREAYAACGGFPPLPLMEDVAFIRRLRGTGPLAFPRTRAVTSPRRWEQRGLVAATLANWWTFAQYAAGRSPEALAVAYRRRTAPRSSREGIA